MGDSARNTTVIPIGAKTSLFVGAVLRDRYVLEQLLGEGGMGRVFLATDREVDGADRFVAIKVLGDVFREHPQSLSVLRKEATNARKLTHPNIVRVHTFDRDGPHVFIVMEYIRGESLDHFIKRHKEGLPFAEAWPMIRDCARALSYMHAKEVVHSDFKPGNVFRTEDGEIKVLDLGLARTIDGTVAMDGRTRFDTGSTAAQPLGLTPEYASCEMWEPGTKPDPRDDIYALGCVTYQLLTGRHPYNNVPAPRARLENLKPAKPNHISRRRWRALQDSLAFARVERSRSVDSFLQEFDHDRPRISATPWILLTVFLLAVGVAAAFLFRPQPPDAKFVQELLASRPVEDRRAAKIEDVRGWEAQGRIGLELAGQAFKDEDYPAGEYYLHDGPTNAHFSFESLLKRSTAIEDRRAGAEGLLALSKMYVIPARALSATNPDEAARWACLGLQINPYEADLRALYDQLEKTMTPGAITASGCAGDSKPTAAPGGAP